MVIKTKIIATVGPATADRKVIGELIENGVDVFRLNFSHGSFDYYALLLDEINAARGGAERVTAVMGDLCGPKIRTGLIDSNDNMLLEGSEITIVNGSGAGTAKCFGTNYEFFVHDVEVGDRVFIDDGQLSLLVVSKNDDEVVCRVIVGGELNSSKGINLPDTKVSIPSITPRDWKCVDWAIERGMDFLALSFVRSAADVQELKDYLVSKDSHIKVVSKIETPQAVADLEAVVDVSDVVLVARGDLGVEMDLAEVPLIQKRITRLCHQKGKPVIVATQMLQSMIDMPTATRAEISDVANAIMDLTDAVMLSGETAVGKYPVEVLKTIRQVATYTETYLDSLNEPRDQIKADTDDRLVAALAPSVAYIVDQIAAPMVATWSESGRTAAFFSKARIDSPILAYSSEARVCRQMCMQYGVIPQLETPPGGIDEFAEMVEQKVLKAKLARAGDKIVLVTTRKPGSKEKANVIVVHTVLSD
ncbi:MAG: pyruvate kinase [Phycisphaerae bacterium]|nr:pyruvate kinase [Phycisphaerae bacterium]